MKTPPIKELLEYSINYGVREPQILADLRNETSKLGNSHMQITQEQGAFMSLLAKLINAQNYLEIGVFTGYSSLWLALSLPDAGRVTALEINEEYLSIARKYWLNAKVMDKIEIIVGDAKETLDKLSREREGKYDIAFLDANKAANFHYYEYCLKLIRPGGVILLDNVWLNGQILQNPPLKNYVAAQQHLNELIKNDTRVDICTLSIADGLTIARKR